MSDLNFQQRWMNDMEYIKSIEIKGGLYIFKVLFNPRWVALGNEEIGIKIAPDETTNGVYFYYANINEVNINDMFEHIEAIINMNLAIEEKAKLLKMKIEELKVLFENTDIDKLRTMEFVFHKPKSTRGRKPKKSIIEESSEIVENEINSEEQL